MFKEIKDYNYTHPIDFDFEALCTLLAKQQYSLAAEQIKTLVAGINLSTLSFDKHSYTRNIIVNNGDHWLGLLNWDKGATTPIHGHPERTFMYLIKGQIKFKNFTKNPLLELDGSELNSGEYRYNTGVKDRMDNCIHQISANQKSLSLHFYSDNPSKGEVF